jgi:hypothetical protein
MALRSQIVTSISVEYAWEIQMPRRVSSELIPVERIERQIYVVRGQRVMLDGDLAELYGVLPKVLNQAMKRNAARFPDDFAFRLTLQEFRNLMSQIVTSSLAHGGRRKLPTAFTEQGVAMLSSVLRSPMAVRVNIEIMGPSSGSGDCSPPLANWSPN